MQKMPSVAIYFLWTWNGAITISISFTNIKILIKLICGSQLPRKPHQKTKLLQLNGRWQYDSIMWLALCSIKSNVNFLNQICYFSIKQLVFLTNLGGPLPDLIHCGSVRNWTCDLVVSSQPRWLLDQLFTNIRLNKFLFKTLTNSYVFRTKTILCSTNFHVRKWNLGPKSERYEQISKFHNKISGKSSRSRRNENIL